MSVAVDLKATLREGNVLVDVDYYVDVDVLSRSQPLSLHSAAAGQLIHTPFRANLYHLDLDIKQPNITLLIEKQMHRIQLSWGENKKEKEKETESRLKRERKENRKT